MKRIVLAWLFVAVAVISGLAGKNPAVSVSALSDSSAKTHKELLLVLSYNESISTTFCVPFQRTLRDSPFDCNLTIVSLNSQNGTTPTEWGERVKQVLPDIKDGKFDAVVILNQAAYTAVSAVSREFPEELPVFFSRLRFFDGISEAHRNTTGNFPQFSPQSCADLGRTLFPTRHQIILIDSGHADGRSIERRMRLYAENTPDIKLTVLNDGHLTIQEALGQLAKFHENGFILYHSWFLENENRPDVEDSFLAGLLMHTSIPVFRLINLDSPQYGVIGGVVASSREEGAVKTARQLIECFNGRKASDIPVAILPSQTIINYDMLAVYNIPESRVPNHVRYLGKRETLWSVYQRPIIAAVAIIVLLSVAVAIVSLLFGLYLRRNYQVAQILRKMPLRCLVVDEQENILYNLYCDGKANEYAKSHPIRAVEDLPPESRVSVRECVRRVMASGRTVYYDYVSMGEKRTAIVSSFPKSSFGRKVVVWISQNTTELQNTRSQLKKLLFENQRNLAALKRSDYENRMILDNVQIPIWLYDAHGNLLHVNRAVCIAAGMDSHAILNLPDRQVFCSALPSNEKLPIEQVIQTGHLVRREVSYHNRDYIISAEPVFDRAGQLTSIVKSAVDVTELNAFIANERVLNSCFELLMNEQEGGRTLDQVLGIVCSHMKADHCFMMKFDYAKKRAGVVTEFVGDGGERIYPAGSSMPLDTSAPWFKNLERNRVGFAQSTASASQDPALASWRTHLTKFDIQSIHVSGIFVGGDLWGEIVFCYHGRGHAFTDRELVFLKSVAHMCELLMEREQSRGQTMGALQQARAADKAKSFFVASVSHELRTPLNSVIGFLELLMDDSLTREVQKDYIRSIAYSGNALLQLINDVLDLSKLEADQMLFTPVETNVGMLAQEVGMIFKQKCEGKGLFLRYSIAPMPLIYIDRSRLRQIFFNLLGNAVKFTEHGGITIQAEFVAEEGDAPSAAGQAEAKKGAIAYGALLFSVNDTGVGIAPDDQKRLFQPFVQSNAMRGTYAANNGTGLGLALVHRMLERMNGTIVLTSTLGMGSSFKVEIRHLPFIPGSMKVVVPGTDSANGIIEIAAPDFHDSPFRDLSVLLVDDVAMNLKVLAAIVRKLGANVLTAQNGRGALELMQTHKITLVLTDLWMPGMNGAELAGRIRSDKRWANVPVVAVTADIESGITFDTTWFVRILTKPVTVAKVRELLALAKKDA